MQNFGAFNNATTRRPFQLRLPPPPPPPPPILNPALNKTVASQSFMNFIYSSFTSAPLTMPHSSHCKIFKRDHSVHGKIKTMFDTPYILEENELWRF